MKVEKTLKGGSLSRTEVVRKSNKLVVRKSISCEENREFGFYRWLGQYRKMMYLNEYYPDLIPRPFNFKSTGLEYFYCVEYYDKHVSGIEFLIGENPDVEKFFNAVINAMERLQSNRKEDDPGLFEIYWNEEVLKRVKLAYERLNFLKPNTVYELDGIEVKSLALKDLTLESLGVKEVKTFSCHTHGNLTLENILYDPKNDNLKLVDLYEENFVDTAENEISQLFQSSKYLYEICSSKECILNDNKLIIKKQNPKKIKDFNSLLEKYVDKKYTVLEKKMIKLYEASQFFRMVPFKIEHSVEHAIYFFLRACSIIEETNA